MGYHSTGTLTLINEDGKKSKYVVDTYGNRLILTSKEGQWDYISDRPTLLIENLNSKISDLENELRLFKEAKKVLKDRLKGKEAL